MAHQEQSSRVTAPLCRMCMGEGYGRCHIIGEVREAHRWHEAVVRQYRYETLLRERLSYPAVEVLVTRHPTAAMNEHYHWQGTRQRLPRGVEWPVDIAALTSTSTVSQLDHGHVAVLYQIGGTQQLIGGATGKCCQYWQPRRHRAKSQKLPTIHAFSPQASKAAKGHTPRATSHSRASAASSRNQRAALPKRKV